MLFKCLLYLYLVSFDFLHRSQWKTMKFLETFFDAVAQPDENVPGNSDPFVWGVIHFISFCTRECLVNLCMSMEDVQQMFVGWSLPLPKI